jgi:hypothetical protein
MRTHVVGAHHLRIMSTMNLCHNGILGTEKCMSKSSITAGSSEKETYRKMDTKQLVSSA